jgi:hypothetical protein
VQGAAVELHVLPLQRDRLADPQARHREQEDQRAQLGAGLEHREQRADLRPRVRLDVVLVVLVVALAGAALRVTA